MKVIGFTEKYYTLWDVSEHIEETEHEKYKLYTFSYIKNISTDFEKTRAMYPDLLIDLSLRGHSTFQQKEIVETKLTIDDFRFGKYKGKKIADSEDVEYMKWYATQISEDDPHFAVVLKALEDKGYHFHCGWFYTDEEYAVLHEHKENYLKYIDMIEKGEQPVFFMTSNLKVETDYDYDVSSAYCVVNVGDNFKFVFYFKNFKEMTYNDYVYALPVKGKSGKKIKNKNVKILDAYIMKKDEYTTEVMVNDFDVLKS